MKRCGKERGRGDGGSAQRNTEGYGDAPSGGNGRNSQDQELPRAAVMIQGVTIVADIELWRR